MAGNDEPGDTERDDEERAARVSATRERFTALTRLDDSAINLAEGALLIAAEEVPDLDIERYLRELDRLGERVRLRVDEAQRQERHDADEAALGALHAVLFDEEGYRGEVASAADGGLYPPRNSFLNDVMDRKRGMPITLSVIYCEVARRAGLEAVGIAAPLHFVVQFRGRHTSKVVDPFNRGARIEPSALADVPLMPASRKMILARMLANLKLVYVRRQQYMKALAAIERILALQPSAGEVRDRGLVLQKLGEHILRQGRERFLRERAAETGGAEAATAELRRSMQLALHLLGSAWFDLSLYARVAEGVPGAADAGQAATQLWQMLGRRN